MKRLFTAAATVSLAFLFTSCVDQYTICDTATTVNVNSTFFESSTGLRTAPSSFSLSPLGANPIYSNLRDRTSFSVQLDASKDSAVFVIQLAANAQADTFKLRYTTQTQVISPDCGSINVFNISQLSTTKNTIDSIVLINPFVSNAFAQNLRIYY